MTELENNAISQCRAIVDNFKLMHVKAIIDEYLPLIDNEDKISTFVDLSGIPDDLIKVAASICGMDILGKYEKQLRTVEDWEVRIEQGEETAVFVGDQFPKCSIVDDSVDFIPPIRLVVTLPSERFADKKIVLISAGNIDNASTRKVASSGRLVLLTNATMPLTNVQKGWIDSFVKEGFDLKRFAVYIAHTEKLLEDSQETEVVDYVRTYLDQYSTDIPIFYDESAVTEFVSSDNADQYAEAKVNTVLNMIREIDVVLENEIKSLSLKEEEYTRISREISRMSAAFVHAGELSANNVLGNHISEIIDAIDKSAEEYSNEMFDSIKQTILSAKDIDDVEEKIAPYMEKSWEFFAKETSVQISKDFNELNIKLTQRMETDVEDMVKTLDMNAQSVIAEFVNDTDSMYFPVSSYEQASDEARNAVKRNARNLIILSIPMLFISPTLSVATILGSGIYSKLGNKQEDKKYRDELIDHVGSACRKARKDAIGSFENTLQEEQERMKGLVLEGYQNFLNLILQNLEERRQNADASVQKAIELTEAKDKLNFF